MLTSVTPKGHLTAAAGTADHIKLLSTLHGLAYEVLSEGIWVYSDDEAMLLKPEEVLLSNDFTFEYWVVSKEEFNAEYLATDYYPAHASAG